MFSLNHMGAMGPHQTRQFSTFPVNKPLFNTMASTSFLSKIDWQNISSQKKFVNPNFVNKKNPNIHSCPPNFNLHPPRQLRDICSEFSVKTNLSNSHTLPKYFITEQIEMKENTQRKKEYRQTAQYKKSRDHSRSPKKEHKNKMNIDLKYEIDEVGVDALSDYFESDSNDSTPIIDIQIPPVFVHEALPECEIKSEKCKISSSPICITIGSPEKMPTVVVSITEKITRNRLPSECGSEDSFIVFQYGTEDDTSDCESDTESDEDLDSLYSDDEDFSLKTDEGNSKDSIKLTKKVTFAKDLCKVYPMIKWSYAYQTARKGPWEQYARDRGRFKDRIAKSEEILRPILQADHRLKVYQERYV